MTIEIPVGDYHKDEVATFCERFGCKLVKVQRGYFIIEADEATKFFWLGCNWNFHYKTGIAISAASEIFNQQKVKP